MSDIISLIKGLRFLINILKIRVSKIEQKGNYNINIVRTKNGHLRKKTNQNLQLERVVWYLERGGSAHRFGRGRRTFSGGGKVIGIRRRKGGIGHGPRPSTHQQTVLGDFNNRFDVPQNPALSGRETRLIMSDRVPPRRSNAVSPQIGAAPTHQLHVIAIAYRLPLHNPRGEFLVLRLQHLLPRRTE